MLGSRALNYTGQQLMMPFITDDRMHAGGHTLLNRFSQELKKSFKGSLTDFVEIVKIMS